MMMMMMMFFPLLFVLMAFVAMTKLVLLRLTVRVLTDRCSSRSIRMCNVYFYLCLCLCLDTVSDIHFSILSLYADHSIFRCGAH